MTLEEPTPIVTSHQQAIARHEQWQIEHEEAMRRIDEKLEATAAAQQLNAQQLNTLTAGLLELRNLVADYLRGRSQP